MISVQQCHDVLSRDSPVGRRHHSGASSWFSTLVWHQLRNPEKGRGLAAGKNRSRLYFRGLWGKRGPKGLKWLSLRRWPRTPPFIFRVNVAAVDAAGGNRKWKIPVGLWLVCPTWDWWVGRVKLKTVQIGTHCLPWGRTWGARSPSDAPSRDDGANVENFGILWESHWDKWSNIWYISIKHQQHHWNQLQNE